MKIEVAKAIVEAANECGYEMKLREDYSGRGMFGRTTTGIVYDSESDMLKSVALAAIRVKEKESEEGAMTAEEFIDELDFSRDNMGYSTIVY